MSDLSVQCGNCSDQTLCFDTPLSSQHAAGFVANTGPESDESVSFIAVSLGRLSAAPERLSDVEEAVEVVVRTRWDGSISSLVCEAFAFSKAGQIVAAITELTFKRVKKSTFARALGANKVSSTSRLKSSVGSASLSSSSVVDSKSETRKRVLEIIREGTGLTQDEISPELTLEELGVDSLLSIEIISKLKNIVSDIDSLEHEFST